MSYIVLNRDKQMIGKANKMSRALKIAGKRKNVAIAQISKAWERGTSREPRKHRRHRRH